MSRTKGAHGKHKKEKPVKEKKKRGRPSKQHQHQQQHQIVNVNVGGGGGGGGGNKTIPIPFQLPSTIYDPSLITPNYGINDRQPVNPLTDAATDLMTPMIQSLISNQAQKVDRIPIKDAVKPVNPVLNKPPPQAIPISQKDHSHPLPPEILIDSDFQSPIHNKHMDHKNLQKIVQPQVPKIKPPKKIKDIEGLGAKIPIQNIGAIAGNIAGAALTGGATAATEALVMGGTAGLMGAGESIIGATIGAGVAGGVSTALGNSAAGHIISGVAGGIAGRAAGRAIANRRIRPQTTSEEQLPLLGNRLGGRRGRNRLVQKVQETHDPITGEKTQWKIPEYEPPKNNTMDMIKTVITKKMKNVSDGINNLSQQIRGKPNSRGTYAQIPSVDEFEPVQPLNQIPTLKSRALERDKLDLQKDKFEQNLNGILTEQKTNAATKIKGMIKLKKHEPGRHALQKVVRQEIKNKQLQDELNNVIQTERRTNAATKIQNVVRGNKTRKQLPNMIDEYNTQLLIDKVNKLEQRANKINDSAVAIQKKFRQYKRKTTPISISNDAPTTTIQPANLIADNVSRSVVRNSLNKVARNQNLNIKAANISQKTLDDAMKQLIQEDATSNIKKLSKGILQHDKQLYVEKKAAKISKRVNISNFAKLANQTTKLKEVRQNKQMQAARKKYNKIGEMMMPKSFDSFDKTNSSANEFIQTTARKRMKKFQDQISHLDTRSTLPEREKSSQIKEAQKGISRMDKIIQKKSTGRTRTRTGGEETGSRLSLLSTTSTRAAMTPRK